MSNHYLMVETPSPTWWWNAIVAEHLYQAA